MAEKDEILLRQAGKYNEIKARMDNMKKQK